MPPIVLAIFLFRCEVVLKSRDPVRIPGKTARSSQDANRLEKSRFRSKSSQTGYKEEKRKEKRKVEDPCRRPARDLPYPRKIWGLPTFFASTTANRWTARALPDDPADDLARRFREMIPARAIDEIKRQRYRPSLSFSIIDLHHRHAAALSLKRHIARVTACPGFSQSRRHPSRRNHRHHPQHLQVQCRENQTGSQ